MTDDDLDRACEEMQQRSKEIHEQVTRVASLPLPHLRPHRDMLVRLRRDLYTLQLALQQVLREGRVQ